jgi:hypothetical protein
MIERKTQLSVFVPNKLGELTKVTEVLSKANINLEALTIAETKDFGVLRLIADDEEKAFAELTEHGFVTKKSPVLAASMESRPGALNGILAKFAEAQIAVEYIYSSVAAPSNEKENAYLIFKVSNIDKAEALF